MTPSGTILKSKKSGGLGTFPTELNPEGVKMTDNEHEGC
jgi:hypothetical protein